MELPDDWALVVVHDGGLHAFEVVKLRLNVVKPGRKGCIKMLGISIGGMRKRKKDYKAEMS